MKNELSKFAEQNNLTYDASSKVLYGEYNGCQIVVKEVTRKWYDYLYASTNVAWRYYFSIPARASVETPEGSMRYFINNLLEDKKVVKAASYDGLTLKLEVAMSTKAKNLINLDKIFKKVSSFITENAYYPCCELCGEYTETSVYTINDITMCGCSDCYNQTISSLEEKHETAKNKPGNIITGLVGAFIGSLIGVALWVAVFALGYIAALCGFVLAITIIKGYELFGGKLNALGIFSTIMLTLIMVYVATYLSYGYSIYDTFKETDNIDIFTAIRSVNGFLKEIPEFSNSFHSDLFLGYVFTTIGTVTTFITAYKKSNAVYSTKKI